MSIFRTAFLVSIPLAIAQPSFAASQSESVNWRVWNTEDGMVEGYISQVSRTSSGRILVRHGDVATMNVLDGFHLTNQPDVQSLGKIEGDGEEHLSTFDRSGVLVYSKGKWDRHPVAEVTGFTKFGLFEHIRWYEYPFKTDIHPRVAATPSEPGKMLFSLSGNVVEWSGLDGQTRVLRQSAKGAIGEFIQVSPAGEGTFFVSGVHGLAILSPETGAWTELPNPPIGFSRFVFPSSTRAHGIITTATGPDGRKRLLSLTNGKWQVLYSGESSLRGWESGTGLLWALASDKLILFTNQQPRQINLNPVISGKLIDVERDGDAFWLATSQGLARYAPPLWQQGVGTPEFEATVNSIAEDKQGTLWITSGSLLLSQTGNKWRTYKLPKGEIQNVSTGSICPMNNGHLLLATEGKVICWRWI